MTSTMYNAETHELTITLSAADHAELVRKNYGVVLTPPRLTPGKFDIYTDRISDYYNPKLDGFLLARREDFANGLTITIKLPVAAQMVEAANNRPWRFRCDGCGCTYEVQNCPECGSDMMRRV